MSGDPLSYVSEEDFEKIYKRIKYRVVEGIHPSEKPFAVILGGQPGAGKSNIYDYYERNITNNFVRINCDDYREYHPNFKEIYEKYGDADSDYTQDFVSRVNKRLVSELSKEKYNMIVESTLHSTRVPLAICGQLKKLNYSVELCVMGTYKAISWQSTIVRKEEMKKNGIQPRGVTKEYHDYVCKNICNSLSIVYQSKKMDNILVLSREKSRILYDARITPDLNPEQILSARLYNPPEKASKIIDRIMQQYRKAKGRSEELKKSMAAAFNQVLKTSVKKLRADTVALDDLTKPHQRTFNPREGRNARDQATDSEIKRI